MSKQLIEKLKYFRNLTDVISVASNDGSLEYTRVIFSNEELDYIISKLQPKEQEVSETSALAIHRKSWEGKSDEWLFERLNNELKQKVEEIHSLTISPKEQLSAEEVLVKTLVNADLGYKDEDIRETLKEDSEVGKMVRAILKAMHDFANNSEAMKENAKLKYMIDNGLGWEDMKNDIKYPTEL